MDARVALKALIGGLLLATGTLIALSCGLCTGYFGILSVGSLFDEKSRDTLGFTAPFLLAGLVATAVGVGLAWGGLVLLRASPKGDEGTPADSQD